MNGTGFSRHVARRRRSTTVGLVILATLVGLLVPTNTAAAYWQPKGCADVFFVGARGSGQNPYGDGSDNGSGFGREVYRVWTTFNTGLGRNVQPDTLGPAYPSYSVDLLKPTKAEL